MFVIPRSAVASLVVLGSVAAPAVSSAQPVTEFLVTGTVLEIDAGDVRPAGESGRWVVLERHIRGIFYGSVGGDEGTPFVLTYGSNVPIATQSGQVHGSIVFGGYEASIRAQSSIGLTPVPCAFPDGYTCIPTPNGNFVPGLILTGAFTFVDSTVGRGDLRGWVIPELDAEGHIVRIIASSLTLSGVWNP